MTFSRITDYVFNFRVKIGQNFDTWNDIPEYFKLEIKPLCATLFNALAKSKMRSFSVFLYRICLDPCCRSYTVLCVLSCYSIQDMDAGEVCFQFPGWCLPFFYKYWRMVPVRCFFLMSKTYWIFCSYSSTTSWSFSLILYVPTALLDITRWLAVWRLVWWSQCHSLLGDDCDIW